MAASLMTKFNEITANEFDYLVLESVEFDISAETVRVNVIYPEPKEQIVRANSAKIQDAIIDALRSKASVVVKLTKSHFDECFFVSRLITFFEQMPSIAPYVFAENVKIVKNAEYDFSVKLGLDSDVYSLAVARGVVDDVKKMLASAYCEKVSFEIYPIETEHKKDYIEIAEEELRNYVYETDGGHFIIPQNVEELVGKIIYDRAGYISDVKREMTGAVYCGKVSEFTECEKKQKEGEENEPRRKFYKFTLTDPTGSMKCLYFPRKSETESNIINLHDGKEIVVKGSIKENKFRGQTSYDMFVNAVSLCTLPENIEIEKNEYHAASEYKCVKPEPYVELRQANIFDIAKPVSPWLVGKTFCVFDVETTGLDTSTCKIIELAAVKVIDGKIMETFSTFINPHEPISDKTTALTSITDADVEHAPDAEDVLKDFYKFSEHTTLVGHNVNFDIGFINAEAKEVGIYFENPQMDTLELAKRYLKGLRNYKLGTVIKFFGVENEHAHRAIFDTIATAKAFIKLADYMN